MDVFILDSLYRRIAVIEKYESLIWTERFSAMGDFELHITYSTSTRNLIPIGTVLHINESYRLMRVETVEDYTDDEGRRILKFTGFSLENVYEQRLAAFQVEDYWSPYLRDGTPREIIEYVYYSVVIDGNLDVGDIIDGIELGSDIFPTDTIDEPVEEFFYIAPNHLSLYATIKEICDLVGMGFRLVRHPVTGVLYFDLYVGCDRTTTQSTLAAVIFSPDLDNLKNTNRVTSQALYKNVAYVISAGLTHEIVYATDVDPDISGFDRRVLIVKADDIEELDPDASDKMIQRGKDELAKNRMFDALDGELAVNTGYIYGTHYNLGDLVELRDDSGATSQMKVTEVVIINDKEGRRTYPTLALNLFITPGSWIGWSLVQEWDELDTEEWEDV